MIHQKGTIGFILFGLGIIVLAYTAVSQHLLAKSDLPGTDALQVYQGGQDFYLVHLAYQIAASQAFEQTLQQFTLHGGVSDDLCTQEWYGIWYSADCTFDPRTIQPTFLSLFDSLFHIRLSKTVTTFKLDADFPKEYSYTFKNNLFMISTPEAFVYRSHNHAYSFQPSFALPLDDYNSIFALYQSTLSHLAAAQGCLEDLPSEPEPCFYDPFFWNFTRHEDFFNFTVGHDSTPLTFAIDLNSLSKLQEYYTDNNLFLQQE